VVRRAAIAGLLAASCLADVKVGGPGYKCSSDDDCGLYGPCVASVCSGGATAGGTAGGSTAGGATAGGATAGGATAGGATAGGATAGGATAGGATAGGATAGGATAGGATAGGATAGGATAGGGTAGGAVTGPPWWNAAYTQRANLTITNSAATSLPMGFQVGWLFPIEALIGNATQEQLRIVRWSGTQWFEQHRVIDANGVNQQWMWLRLVNAINAGGSDTSYWVYWGNSAPPAAPQDSAIVFDFYDPFSGTSLGAAWLQQPAASITVTGGEARLDYDEHMRLATSSLPGDAVDFRWRQPAYAGRWWGGYQAFGTFSDVHPWDLWIARSTSSPAEVWPERTEDQSPILEGPRRAVPVAHTLFGVDRFAAHTLYRVNDNVVATLDAGVVFNGQMNVRFTNESAQPLYVGMVRTRKTAFPYPTVTRGPTQP